MTDDRLEGRLRELEDRQAIIALTHLYATALDGRKWELLAECFLPDASADYGGAVGVREGLDAITETCRGVLDPLDSSLHMVSNHVVSLAGDSATCSCYLTAQHTRKGCEGGANFTVGGSYHDDLVRTPSGWRIRKRVLEAAWTEGNVRVIVGG